MKTGFIVVLSSAAACAFAALMIGQVRSPGPPAVVSPVALQPDPASMRSVLLEVERPAGSDDAIWQRVIATYLVKVRDNPVLERAMHEPFFADASRPEHEKLANGILDSVYRFSLAVTARQLPGTALIELRLDCSNDYNVNAKATNEYVGAFLRTLEEDELTKYSRSLDALKTAEFSADLQYKNERDGLEAWAKAHGVDLPVPAGASPMDKQERAQLEREFKSRSLALEEERVNGAEIRRRVNMLDAERHAVPQLTIHIVQSAI